MISIYNVSFDSVANNLIVSNDIILKTHPGDKCLNPGNIERVLNDLRCHLSESLKRHVAPFLKKRNGGGGGYL